MKQPTFKQTLKRIYHKGDITYFFIIIVLIFNYTIYLSLEDLSFEEHLMDIATFILMGAVAFIIMFDKNWKINRLKR